jgi:hypothetical protein
VVLDDERHNHAWNDCHNVSALLGGNHYERDIGLLRFIGNPTHIVGNPG